MTAAPRRGWLLLATRRFDKELSVADLLFVVLTVALFAAFTGLVKAAER
ncbi:hypothetical protein [Actinoplanes philippinensis]|nr:hypothetical protein [Actinoplanes philippinensis]